MICDILIVAFEIVGRGIMARKIFLVDTENVGTRWKHLFEIASSTDKIILFYTDNTPHLSYTDLEIIKSNCDRFTMEKCYTGNNALDFQLISYMGYHMKSSTKSQFIIVSNDCGYDSVIHFWKDRGRDIIRMKTIELDNINNKQIANSQEKDTKTSDEEIEQKLCEIEVAADSKKKITSKNKPSLSLQKKSHHIVEKDVIKDVLINLCSDEQIEWIKKMLEKYSLSELQKIYAECVKKYGQDAGKEIYHSIKPKLAKYLK